MGYTHGKHWNEKMIEEEIRLVMKDAEIDTMPTQSIMKEYTGSLGLNNAISRSGGFIAWANRLNIEHKGLETVLGERFEDYCKNYMMEKLGLDVETMKRGHPYDLLVNKNIKVDVKTSRLYDKEFSCYTFNLEKRYPTCDVFVAYCISEGKEIIKTYVVPSKILSGLTQLSVGVTKSRYDIYLDKWDVIKKYDDFYKSLCA